MQRTVFNVLIEIDGTQAEHEVEVRNVDRLQAEVSGRQSGILADLGDAPMTWTTHWLWHACKRLGLYSGTWQEFKTACVEFESATEDEDDAEVPPIQRVELMRSASS